MRRLLLLLTVLIVVLMMTGSAGAYDLIGPGNAICQSWTDHHRAAARNQPTGAAMDEAWVGGFLSGVGATGWGNPLGNTSGENVMAWITNYCFAHPRETIAKAAMAFATEHPQ